MLKEFPLEQKQEGPWKEQLKALRLDLSHLQQPVKTAGLPVVVLIEGWAPRARAVSSALSSGSWTPGCSRW